MVDFRKWLTAFAGAALLFGLGSSQAYAQATAFICNATAGNPHIVRAEGVAELVGDLVLNCTGGQFTPAGQVIPPSNVQINLNTNVTSRLTGAGASLDSEALLTIDEPFPTGTGQSPFPPTAIPVTGAATTQLGCVADGLHACLAITSLGWGFGASGSYNGAAGTAGDPNGHANMFQGLVNPAAPSQINWQGVPIDAPGTTITRVIRITNVRANACMLGVSSTLVPATITELIGVSGSQTIIINNPLQTVALVEKGLIGSVTGGAPSYTQCNSLNDFLINGTPGTATTLSMNATEGFAAAFKTVVAFQSGTTYPQNVLGISYNTESGYVPLNVSGLDQTNTVIGLADTGTEITFNLTGIGAGVSLYVPVAVNLINTITGTPSGGVAYLVGSLGGGIGASFNPPAASTALTPVTVSGTTASITYEITSTDPNTIERLSIPVAVAYITTSPTVPASGASSVSINFAPLSLSTQNVSSKTAPVPRFCQPYGPATAFSIVPCTCNLLFPFVTNQAGFDTGVAIANTSQDPYGTVPQAGSITLWYYGTSTGSSTPPPPVTSDSVPAGQVLTFEVSSGGSYGIPATAGFQGYIIAQANFQFCHGFAFISDLGAQKLAEGYLAISLDTPSEINAIQQALTAFGGPSRGGVGGTATPPVAGEDHGH